MIDGWETVSNGERGRERRVFKNRADAGRKLAEELMGFVNQETVILAIPRGGVVVAAEVAKALNAPMDLVIPRKLGAPQNEELAIGAVAGPNEAILDEHLVKSMQISEDYIRQAIAKELKEIERRRQLYLGNCPEIELFDKIAIIVDDGLATGATARAAIRAVRLKKPRRILLAVPVGPWQTVKLIEQEADEVICLEMPVSFYAVGQFYQNFTQVNDSRVIDILSRFKKTA